jgi:hypothetical protein
LLDGEAPAVDLQQPELMLRRADVLLQTDLQALACGPGLGRSSSACSNNRSRRRYNWYSTPMPSTCWPMTAASKAT